MSTPTWRFRPFGKYWRAYLFLDRYSIFRFSCYIGFHFDLFLLRKLHVHTFRLLPIIILWSIRLIPHYCRWPAFTALLPIWAMRLPRNHLHGRSLWHFELRNINNVVAINCRWNPLNAYLLLLFCHWPLIILKLVFRETRLEALPGTRHVILFVRLG